MDAKAPSVLTSLVDDPNETLAVEYKSWMDLSDRKHAADLARHIAAIANHGGGAIVFGIADDMSPATIPDGAAELTRDAVAAVVKRYLDPPLQCDVSMVTSALGNRHPVIRVPAHGAMPVLARRNGPDSDGVMQGIAGGSIYIRKAGPESAAVTAGSELADLIRRCTLHDRASIIAAITSALPGQPPPATAKPAIDVWHDAAEREFLTRISGRTVPIDLSKLRWQFSYALTTADGERMSFDGLRDAMWEVSHETRDLVETGWSMFFPFTSPEIAPTWVNDAGSGDDEDLIQTSLIEHATINGNNDFWRLSTLGMATLVREFWEDRPAAGATMRGEGGRLDVFLLRRNLTEFVRHARGMAERFGQASSMTFRCEWHGLAGRVPLAGRFDSVVGRRAQVGTRSACGTWPVGELASGWPRIVEALAAPIARTFEIRTHLAEQAIGEQPRDLR